MQFGDLHPHDYVYYANVIFKLYYLIILIQLLSMRCCTKIIISSGNRDRERILAERLQQHSWFLYPNDDRARTFRDCVSGNKKIRISKMVCLEWKGEGPCTSWHRAILFT